jgi:hypothetical protein
MPPSKKILIGIWLLAAALVLQVILGLTAYSIVKKGSGIISKPGPSGEDTKQLTSIQKQADYLFIQAGAIRLLMISGVIFFAAGVYQNSKATEKLRHPRE